MKNGRMTSSLAMESLVQVVDRSVIKKGTNISMKESKKDRAPYVVIRFSFRVKILIYIMGIFLVPINTRKQKEGNHFNLLA